MGTYIPLEARPLDLTKMEGQAIEGILVGSKEVGGTYGPQTIWKFQTVDGTRFFDVYNFKNLETQLESVPAGTQVEMTYTGLSEKLVMTKKGGEKHVHEVTVRVYTPSTEEEKTAILEKHLGAKKINDGKPTPTTTGPAISKQAEKLGQHSTLYYDLLKQVESKSTRYSLTKLVEDTLGSRTAELTEDDRNTLREIVAQKFVELKKTEKELPF